MSGLSSPSTTRPSLPAERFEELAGPGLRTFFRIARAWNLDTREAMTLLGLDAESTFFKWKREPDRARLGRDALERISYVLGIYKALHILFPRPETADAWVRKPDTAFAGRSALDRMTRGSIVDLHAVRSYLDAERGWN